MTLKERVLAFFGKSYQASPSPAFKKRVELRTRRRRSFYAAAKNSRLTSGWSSVSYSSDTELQADHRALVSRSRDLSRNNEYARRFFKLVAKNVIGHTGIMPQSLAMRDGKTPDDAAREKIESGFKKWAKKGVCEITGKYSLTLAFQLAITHIAKDGEVLIRHIRNADNRFKYAFQLIEADHLDLNYNETLTNGTRVKMGIELDAYNRPLAYYLFKNHPGDTYNQTKADRVRVPAAEIIHAFLPERISQNRGIPWISAAVDKLKQLGGFEEAAVIASRVAANKGIFYKKPPSGEAYRGDDVDADDGDAVIYDLEPGLAEVLEPDWDVKTIDFQHPTTAYSDFVQAVLKGISSGLSVPYHTLASDLRGVNYTSSRQGELDVRDEWRLLQGFFIDTIAAPIFEAWLEMALLTQAVTLPIRKIDQWENVQFDCRGWQWVDPLKDVQATEKAIEIGVESATDAARAAGKDYEQVIAQQARERDIRQKNKLTPKAEG